MVDLILIIIKKAKSYFAKILDEGKELKIITVGSKGNDQLKRVYGDKIIEIFLLKSLKMQIILMLTKLEKW